MSLTRVRTGDLKLIQELNRSIILNMIRECGPISRSEIAERNGISPSTVASAVSDLIKDGYVFEDGTGNSKGGRKPIMLRVSPENHFIIGVAITNSNVTIAEMNLEASVRRKSVSKIENLKGTFVIPHILDSLETFLSKCPTDKECKGISIIVPGIVDNSQGIIRLNTKFHLTNIPLKEIVEKKFNIKTWVENDVKATVLAEKKFGKYSKYNNLIYVTIGDGVGAGIIMDGSVFRGNKGGSGEFGHTSVDRNGIRCECGNNGCLENYVCWGAVFSRIISSISKGRSTDISNLIHNDITLISPSVFCSSVKKKDSLSMDIMEEIVGYMSVGVVNLVHLFNPEVIIFGGSIAHDNEVLIQKINSYVKQHAIPILTENLEIQQTSLGEDAELIGAASVLLQELFLFSLSTDAGIYR